MENAIRMALRTAAVILISAGVAHATNVLLGIGIGLYLTQIPLGDRRFKV